MGCSTLPLRTRSPYLFADLLLSNSELSIARLTPESELRGTLEQYESKVARRSLLEAKELMAQHDPRGHVSWPKDLAHSLC